MRSSAYIAVMVAWMSLLLFCQPAATSRSLAGMPEANISCTVSISAAPKYLSARERERKYFTPNHVQFYRLTNHRFTMCVSISPVLVI